MNTEISENEERMDVLDASVDLSPKMITEIYQEAQRHRAEAVHDGFVRMCGAVRRATVAICRVLFTSEARRHA
ncbi:MAG: hypothetical protein O3B37_10420 [Proteobacteria bacterium]|nr:hypothetical protein [Pseudomonadota bacterium]